VVSTPSIVESTIGISTIVSSQKDLRISLGFRFSISRALAEQVISSPSTVKTAIGITTIVSSKKVLGISIGFWLSFS
jgi:hypothetical protein